MSVNGSVDSYAFPSSAPVAERLGAGSNPAPAKKYGLASLPGHGSKPSYCGEERLMVCNTCEKGRHGFVAHRSCLTRGCPECHGKWAHKEAKKAAVRLWTGAHLVARKLGIRRKRVRIQHYMVSFAVDALSTVNGDFRRCYEVLKKHGVAGGTVVCHPWRVVDGVYSGDGYVHFHCVGVAYGDVKPSEKGQDYVFKVIRDAKHGDYRGIRRVRDAVRILAYELGHAGLIEGQHALRWFGVLSYNKLSSAALEEAFPEAYEALTRVRGAKCPFCGSDDTEAMDGWIEDERMCTRWERKRSRYLLSGIGVFANCRSPATVVAVEDYF